MALAIFEFAHITGRAIECILHGEVSRKDGGPRWRQRPSNLPHIAGRALECILDGEASQKYGRKRWLS